MMDISTLLSRNLKDYFELDFLEITTDGWWYRDPELQITEHHDSAFLCMHGHSDYVKEFWAHEARWIYKGNQYHGRIRPEVDAEAYDHTALLLHQWGFSCSLNQDKTTAGLIRMIENSIKDYNNKQFNTYAYQITSSTQNHSTKVLDAEEMVNNH